MDTSRQRYIKRLGVLENERSTWIYHWQEIAEYIKPRSFRYLQNWTNKGWKRNQNIINNTPSRALRTMAAGMMGGITSPARPWFRLTLSDPSVAATGPAREWLDVVQDRIRDAFAASNFYNGLHTTYEYLGGWGTAALHLEADEQDTLRAYPFPLGQYTLANSSRLQVDSVFRKFKMTVAQVVERFGKDACSQMLRAQYDNGGLDAWVSVLHVIEPRRDYDPAKADGKNKPFASCWMELEGGDGETRLLSESGYEEFPVMCPRWSVTGEDVYGEAPGMDALGDIKALQLLERRKAQAVDKIVNPPMRAPTALRNQRASLLPGDVTYVDSNAAGQTFAPAIEINPNAVSVVEASCREHEQRIASAFFADLWLLMAQNDEGVQQTAREVAEKHEEKMIQLGPVMERLERELLKPAIDRAFGILMRAGKIPPPPREIQGQEFVVEYISIMAQAQKMLGLAGIERTVAFAGNLAGTRPDVLDNLDVDKILHEYADMVGIKSNLLLPPEQVQALRAQRAQQQQAQAQAEQAQALAKGAQTLSQADMQGDNALTRLLGGLPAAANGTVQ